MIMAGTDESSFEDPYPRKPGIPDWHDNAPDWKMANIYVSQASVALKTDEKSTPLRDNALYNLERAIKALQGLL